MHRVNTDLTTNIAEAYYLNYRRKNSEKWNKVKAEFVLSPSNFWRKYGPILIFEGIFNVHKAGGGAGYPVCPYIRRIGADDLEA